MNTTTKQHTANPLRVWQTLIPALWLCVLALLVSPAKAQSHLAGDGFGAGQTTSAYTLNDNGFQGFQDAKDVEQVVGSGRVVGTDAIGAAGKDHKVPVTAIDITPIDGQVGVGITDVPVEYLPNQHCGQSLPGRVAGGVNVFFELGEGEERNLRGAETAGNECVGLTEQLDSIYFGLDKPVGKEVEMLARKPCQGKHGANETQAQFLLIPVQYIHNQWFLKAEQFLSLKIAYVGRHSQPVGQNGIVEGWNQSEGLFQIV